MRASGHTRRSHTAREPGDGSGLCVTCALTRHDFREMTDAAPDDDTHFSGTLQPHARIDGIHHVLRRAGKGCDTCDDCGKEATSIYVPIR